jgi:hypothetical protein
VIEQVAKLSEEINTVNSNFAKHEEVFQKRQGERLEHVLYAVKKNKKDKAVPVTGRRGP